MGILSVIKNDVEDLIYYGYDNYYISKSVGMELPTIEHIIKYTREKQKQDNKLNKINIRESIKGE